MLWLRLVMLPLPTKFLFNRIFMNFVCYFVDFLPFGLFSFPAGSFLGSFWCSLFCCRLWFWRLNSKHLPFEERKKERKICWESCDYCTCAGSSSSHESLTSSSSTSSSAHLLFGCSILRLGGVGSESSLSVFVNKITKQTSSISKDYDRHYKFSRSNSIFKKSSSP